MHTNLTSCLVFFSNLLKCLKEEKKIYLLLQETPENKKYMLPFEVAFSYQPLKAK